MIITKDTLMETVAEFAVRLSTSIQTVRHWCKLGMPHVRFVKRIRIPVDLALAWIAADGARGPKRSKRTTRVKVQP